MASKRAAVAPATAAKRRVPTDNRKKVVRSLRQRVLAKAAKSGGVRKILRPKANNTATFVRTGPAQDTQAPWGSDIIQQPRLWPDPRGYNDSLLTRRNKKCDLACDKAREGERSWAFERAKKRDKRFSSFGDAMKIKENVWMDIGNNFIKDVLDNQVATQYGNPTSITAIANHIVSSWEPLNHIGSTLETERRPLTANNGRVDAYDGRDTQTHPKYPLLPLRDSDYSGPVMDDRTEPVFGLPSLPRTRFTTRTARPPTDTRTTTSTTSRTPYVAGTGVAPAKVDPPGGTNGLLGLTSTGSKATGSGKTDQENILSNRGQQRKGITSLVGFSGKRNDGNKGPFKGVEFTEMTPNLGLKGTTPGKTLSQILEEISHDSPSGNDEVDSNYGLGLSKTNPPTPVFAHGVISTNLINSFFSEDAAARASAPEPASELSEAKKTPKRPIPSSYAV